MTKCRNNEITISRNNETSNQYGNAAAPAKKATAKKPAVKKVAVKKTVKEPENPHIGLVRNDSWLEPFEDAIRGRHDHAVWKINQLTQNGKRTLSDFATGHLYFGLHKLPKGWVFREWAPNATDIYLIGDFNDWQENEKYRCKRIAGTDNWELKLSEKALKHGQLYKMKVKWNGGEGERIPAWCQRVVQDDQTKIFSAQVWNPEKPYEFKKKNFKPKKNPLLIYECHVGMGQDAEKVGTYTEFKDNVLPRVIKDGYNCIQVMAIQEHPYYGSFGYHVSSFFAPSSRFGTPEELKELIDTAHKNGIAVIMDIVHSHAVKNEVEGLGNLCGDPNQFFYPGDRHEHPAWDSLCFDYGKDDVLHFLLSNCKYWLEEYHFDGFRFDGVTSMLYYSHGLGEAFGGYGDYFNGHEDDNAICYLTLANKLIHEVNPPTTGSRLLKRYAMRTSTCAPSSGRSRTAVPTRRPSLTASRTTRHSWATRPSSSGSSTPTCTGTSPRRMSTIWRSAASPCTR